MKILITGSGGMLARDLLYILPERGHEVIGFVKNELDITNFQAIVNAMDQTKPELVINCAAYNAVDNAEKELDQALLLNGYAVQNLCLACQRYDTVFLHFSTDYVFDGEKKGPYCIYDRPNPINNYGKSKLLGEKYITWLLTKFYVVRTSWLFGQYGDNFVEMMLKLSREKKQLSVVNDQRGCPTWTQHLAQAVADLIVSDRYGFYHITNSGCTTWYDFTQEIFRLADVKVDVVPVSSHEFKRPARRPMNSVLDPYPLTIVSGREMPTWQEALEQYLINRSSKH